MSPGFSSKFFGGSSRGGNRKFSKRPKHLSSNSTKLFTSSVERQFKSVDRQFNSVGRQLKSFERQFKELPKFMSGNSKLAEILTATFVTEPGGYCRPPLLNVYIPHDGHSSELDVLLIHEKGIFVFECKDYGGWIFGSAEQQNWTQALPKGEKHHFYNPIKQNATHCWALSAYLGIPMRFISSYVVFSGRSELKEVPEDTDSQKITHLGGLTYKLQNDLDVRKAVFTPNQVDGIWTTLCPLTQVSEETKDKHIEEAEKFREGTVCPICGGKLILRSGKYGEFYGCSNYPKCKFTRNIQ